MFTYSKRLKGFTLIELIVVIGIIAILAAIVILAVNPARQFASARNARRTNDVKALADAMVQFQADTANSGAMPTTNGTPPGTIAACPAGGITTGTAASTTDANLLSNALVSTYIPSIPADPRGGQYEVCTTTSGGLTQVTVYAPATELLATGNTTPIQITR